MGSGVIYAIILGMWAAYFIPRWLRRHEELSESRSVERFDQAMRILSRREATPDRRQVVMPPRPGPAGASLPARTPLPSQRPPALGASRRPVGASVRRRRTLAALLLATLVAALLAPLTPVPWWVPVLVLVATLGYVAHLRAQVRRGREVSPPRATARDGMAARLMPFDALDRLRSVRRELAEERAAENARWAAAEEAERALRAEEERATAAASGGWEPVPVPLPTYVSKPPAPQPAARPAAQPTPQSASGIARPVELAEGAADELEAIIERRAVND